MTRYMLTAASEDHSFLTEQERQAAREYFASLNVQPGGPGRRASR